jgi:hypothetical protein
MARTESVCLCPSVRPSTHLSVCLSDGMSGPAQGRDVRLQTANAALLVGSGGTWEEALCEGQWGLLDVVVPDVGDTNPLASLDFDIDR